MSGSKKPRVALVYDRVNKFGGAEQILLSLHAIWPEAPLFTSVYNPSGAPWARQFRVYSSFMDRLPFASTRHEVFPWLTPIAFETFSFDEFDIVISVTSAEAKGIITKPETLHICYCLTPTRYLWSGFDSYVKNPGFGPFSFLAKIGLSYLAPTLRYWDKISSQRPDRYIAISNHIKERIVKYYGVGVDAVIYPPVGTQAFLPSKNLNRSKDLKIPPNYYLLVSRMVPYKRADIIIDAATKLKTSLVVIGSGMWKHALRRRAGENVIFIDRHLTQEELVGYYRNCRAFLYAGDEDFGIVAAEAQAAGKPVIAYKDSGIAEIIIDGRTGVLFSKQSIAGVIEAISRFERMKSIDPEECIKNAKRFDRDQFQNTFRSYIEHIYKEYNKTI